VARPVPLLPLLLLAGSPSSKYLEDFEFIQETVARRGAAVASKKIDWKAGAADLRPLFEKCASDAEHVKNAMRLLALLRDSHTGVVETAVDWKLLPSKWDGLYGGGLWLAWDRGRVLVRGIGKGHPLEGSLPLGSAIVEVEGMPIFLAAERERRRITAFQGSSSDHSLFASLGNRFLPFGEKQEVEILALTPEGKSRKLRVGRWGPGGKAYYPSEATLPEGVTSAEGAVSKILSVPGLPKLGYIRITGGMDRATADAFHRAFDALKGMEALLLDCRGMGGGGDGEAWEMAGRLFPKGVANGNHGRIEPSGSWQFDGPVAMLQDELEVSSAETFTWAVSETGRAISVGRTTGGWGIIPNLFKCPSGLLEFRLGVNDRPTPIRGVRTEGIGWPPDFLLPLGPAFCAATDPAREIGLDVLRCLRAGADVEEARKAFAGLSRGEVAAFKKGAARRGPASKGFEPERLAGLVLEDLRATLAIETGLLLHEDVALPDALGAEARLVEIAPRAKVAGLAAALAGLEKAVLGAKAEAQAQAALLETLDAGFAASAEAKKAFLARHGKTRTGRFAAKSLL
jgi:peptidase S41-like protein